jgi:hypothetical protein
MYPEVLIRIPETKRRLTHRCKFIINWVLKIYRGFMWTVFIRLKIGTSVGLC